MMVEALAARTPALKAMSDTGRLTPRPPLSVNRLTANRCHMVTSPAQAACNITAKLATAAAKYPNKFNLGQCIDEHWDAKFLPICEGDWTGPDVGEDDVSANTLCYLAGHCLCTEDGKRLKKFRNNVLATLKMLTHKDTQDMRALLDDGFLVVLFVGRPAESMFGGPPDAAEFVHTFYHISDMLYSPYVPTFMSMKCQSLEEDPYTNLNGEIELEARH